PGEIAAQLLHAGLDPALSAGLWIRHEFVARDALRRHRRRIRVGLCGQESLELLGVEQVHHRLLLRMLLDQISGRADSSDAPTQVQRLPIASEGVTRDNARHLNHHWEDPMAKK